MNNPARSQALHRDCHFSGIPHDSLGPTASAFLYFYCCIAVLLTLTLTCGAQNISITPEHPNGIYDIGQDVAWTVKLTDGTAASMSNYDYVIRKNNLDVIKSGQIDLSTGPARIDI